MANTDGKFGINRRRLLIAAACTCGHSISDRYCSGLARCWCCLCRNAFPNERRIEGLDARNLGILTAHRPDATTEENTERMAQLRAESGMAISAFSK